MSRPRIILDEHGYEPGATLPGNPSFVRCPRCGKTARADMPIFGQGEAGMIIKRRIGPHERDSGRRDRQGRPKMEACIGDAVVPDRALGYLAGYATVLLVHRPAPVIPMDKAVPARVWGVEMLSSGTGGVGGRFWFPDPGDRHKALAQALEIMEREQIDLAERMRAYREQKEREQDSIP